MALIQSPNICNSDRAVTARHGRAVLAWDALAGHSPGRRRPCANHEGRLFLIHRSKANAARWCSMAACGNRRKARRRAEYEEVFTLADGGRALALAARNVNAPGSVSGFAPLGDIHTPAAPAQPMNAAPYRIEPSERRVHSFRRGLHPG
jgi:hypothetical protein